MQKSIFTGIPHKKPYAKVSLFSLAIILTGHMQKYIFACGPLNCTACENTLIFFIDIFSLPLSFPSQHFKFFHHLSSLSSSPLLMSLPILSLSFSPLLTD